MGSGHLIQREKSSELPTVFLSIVRYVGSIESVVRKFIDCTLCKDRCKRVQRVQETINKGHMHWNAMKKLCHVDACGCLLGWWNAILTQGGRGYEVRQSREGGSDNYASGLGGRCPRFHAGTG